MAAAEGDGQRLEPLAAEGHVERDPRALFLDVFRCQGKDGQLLALRRRQQHAARGLLLPPQHDGHAGLHNPRLFQRDLLDRVAEELHVIHAHLGDDADRRGDDIRRVEPPAEADLDHRDIDLFLREAAKRERRAQFELGDLHAVLLAGLHRGPYTFHQRGQLIARNRFAVDADALVVYLDIRRGIQPGLVSRRAEHALDHRAAGALAVRSGDVHHGQLFLRIAEPAHQGAHIFKAVFAAGRVNAVNLFNRFFFRHGESPLSSFFISHKRRVVKPESS